MRPIPTAPCLGLIHEFEKGPNGSFTAVAYQDPAGVWTIGWGHALPGKPPLFDKPWTAAQADQQALDDLTSAAMDVCNALPAVVGSLTEGQYAALIDFVFNVGAGTFNGSTLCHYIRTGNMVLAPTQFALWTHAKVNGVETVLPGLVRRRQAEIAVWRAPS